MEPSLTDQLCTRCGLCCDGSLLADVELTGREAEAMEILGLDVEDDGADGMVMSLPCRALNGTRCRIYEHRPRCCRTFECRLLQEVRNGAMGVEAAHERIADTQAMIANVNRLMAGLGVHDRDLPLFERVSEALAGERDSTGQERAELQAAAATLQASIRKTFLNSPRGARRRRA
jgi:Fe-S-cluster containining protein